MSRLEEVNENHNINVTNYKTLDINSIIFEEPIKSKGGFLSIPKYNGNELFIQTPRLKCSGIIKTDNRYALELEFDKTHGLFYEFITGIDECSANSIICLCSNRRAIIMSLYLLNTLEISLIASRFPIPISFGPKKSACPPIHSNPVSKETLVLAEGFANIIDKDLFLK